MIMPGKPRSVVRGTQFTALSVNINAALTVFLPAANTKGAIIRRGCFYVSNGIYVNVYADTAPPTTLWDATKKLIYTMGQVGATAYTWPDELEIPPGYGLWFFCGTGGGHNLFVSYELL